MPEYPHDPEFPYLVIDKIGNNWARFQHLTWAKEFVRDHPGASFVDTTPKPRIPVDAQYLAWRPEGLPPRFAIKHLSNPEVKDWWYEGHWHSERVLLEIIGDAEITVLDPRKEES